MSDMKGTAAVGRPSHDAPGPATLGSAGFDPDALGEVPGGPPAASGGAATGSASGASPIEGRTPWQLAWQRLRRDRVAMVSLVIIILVILMAVFAPLVAMVTGHPVNE